MYLKGILKLSLAHSPLCWQYRNHVIKIRSISLCLGCTGFYCGLFLGLFLILLDFLNFLLWEYLVVLSFFLYLPTMLRLLKVGYFKTSKKSSRFSMRFLLGLGIATGLLSILKAPNLLFQLIQTFLGLGLYIGITIARIKDPDVWKECEDCSYTRSSSCFGFKQFYYPDSSEVIYPIMEEITNESGIN